MAGEDCLKERYPTLFHIARDRDAGVAYMQKSGMMSVIGPQCFCVVHDWEVDLVE